MYVTLNPDTELLGRLHDTVSDVSVISLKERCEGGSGPKDTPYTL